MAFHGRFQVLELTLVMAVYIPRMFNAVSRCFTLFPSVHQVRISRRFASFRVVSRRFHTDGASDAGDHERSWWFLVVSGDSTSSRQFLPG